MTWFDFTLIAIVVFVLVLFSTFAVKALFIHTSIIYVVRFAIIP